MSFGSVAQNPNDEETHSSYVAKEHDALIRCYEHELQYGTARLFCQHCHTLLWRSFHLEYIYRSYESLCIYVYSKKKKSYHNVNSLIIVNDILYEYINN